METLRICPKPQDTPLKVLRKRYHSRGYDAEKRKCKLHGIVGDELKQRCSRAAAAALAQAGFT